MEAPPWLLIGNFLVSFAIAATYVAAACYCPAGIASFTAADFQRHVEPFPFQYLSRYQLLSSIHVL